MSKEKLYAVKNDEGEFAFCEIGKPHWETGFGTLWTELNKPYAQRTADDIGGHVVELFEKPTPVVVSQEEAEMLEQAKDDYCAASVISAYSIEHIGAMGQDRLMRAYVIGWTVEKPKRYLLPMPDGTSDELDQGKYVAIRETGGIWYGSEHRHDITKQAELEYFFVTQADIDAAPAWVKAITPVEVTDDEQ